MAVTQLKYSQLLEKYIAEGMSFDEAHKKAAKESEIGAAKEVKKVMDKQKTSFAEKAKMAILGKRYKSKSEGK